jgi:hypothetical protein
MICQNYNNLSLPEKIIIIGEIIHAIQNDDKAFKKGMDLISYAKARGILDGVVILPETNTSY